MRPLVLVGVILIVLGIAGLVVANIPITEQKTVLDAGPLKITKNEEKIIPIPTIAGVVAVVVGLGLVVIGRGRR